MVLILSHKINTKHQLPKKNNNKNKLGGVKMLDCKLCNYFKSTDNSSKGVKVCKCELTGFQFNKRVSDYQIEYPCSNVNFERLDMETKESLEMEYDELKLA
jgi:hypothetical protein